MYKNQLQELAQRSCFNLPSYACVREGPDHAPRFKASVNFNGEIFQGPSHCTTLRQAEHAAAEVALTNLSSRAPSRSLAARVLDETGVYKNLLQETTHRAGLKLPVYATVRSGPGHQPIFTSTVELAGMCVTGEQAKTKKQAEKNAAMAAWSALKQLPDLDLLARPRDSESGCGGGGGEEQERVVSYLYNLKPKEENKQARQRDHHQIKLNRKLAGFIDGTQSSPSPHRSSMFPQQCRSHEPSSDFSSMHSSQQRQKNWSFFTPAHSTGPLVMSPLSSIQGKPPSSSVPPHPFTDPSTPLIAARAFDPRSQRDSSTIPIPRMMNTGVFHGHGIAPAVQIRSVIPVCAAPPVRQPPQLPLACGGRPPSITKKESEEDISASTSKFSQLKL